MSAALDERRFGIKQQVKFANPTVRFRRINGRTVPIFNRKKIGTASSRLGTKGLVAGAVGVGASKIIKALDKSKKRPKLRRIGKISGIVGLTSLVGGAALKVAGFNLQSQSEVGYDL